MTTPNFLMFSSISLYLFVLCSRVRAPVRYYYRLGENCDCLRISAFRRAREASRGEKKAETCSDDGPQRCTVHLSLERPKRRTPKGRHPSARLGLPRTDISTLQQISHVMFGRSPNTVWMVGHIFVLQHPPILSCQQS